MLNKKRLNILIILLILILLLNIALADMETSLETDNFPYNYDELELKMNISGRINLTGNINTINKLEAKLNQYPKNSETLKIKYFNPYPDSSIKNNTMIFSFATNNIKKQMAYKIFTQFTNQKDKLNIKKDVSFPLKSIPSEMQEYVLETENIDMPGSLKYKASVLVKDSKTLLDATVNIAKWVSENIIYEEDFETADKVQKSSWVYENKKGVCDEITALFISMTRSVGIPTRFVSGVAYSQKNKKFGNHAWAEIYMPNYGWIPFDITYREYAWLDSTHVPLTKNTDSKINSLECTVIGSSVGINTNKINFDVEIVNKKKLYFPNINLTINALSKNMGFGYNVIEAELVHNYDYIIIPEIELTQVENLEILSPQQTFAILHSGSPQKARWIIRINDSIDNKYFYRFPIEVRLPNNNQSSKIYINVSSQGIFYSESYVKNFINEKTESEINEHASELDIKCETKPIYIINRKTEYKCNITNNANITFNNLNICFKEQCKSLSLEQDSIKQISFTPTFKELGLQTSILNISNPKLIKKEYLNFNVKDQPNIELKIQTLKNITFGNELNIPINISKISKNTPKNMKIKLSCSSIEKEWSYNNFGVNQIINLRLKGKNLYAGNNNLKVEITWENELGEKFETEKTINIELVDLNLWQRFYAFVNKLLNN